MFGETDTKQIVLINNISCAYRCYERKGTGCCEGEKQGANLRGDFLEEVVFKLTCKWKSWQGRGRLGEGLGKGHGAHYRQRVGLRQVEGQVRIRTLLCGHR